MKLFYIFCPWIWVSTFFYLIGLLPFSLLYTSAAAFIFTCFYNTLYLNIHISKLITIISFEFLIFAANYIKHIMIENKPLISYPDLLFNIALFIAYLIYLYFNNRTFYTVYAHELKKAHLNNQDTILQYLKRRLFS